MLSHHLHIYSKDHNSHYSGVYTIKASMHRFLKTGNGTSMPGQLGIPAVYSPMTRTLEDLETFWRAVVGMKPWQYDHTVCFLPICRALASELCIVCPHSLARGELEWEEVEVWSNVGRRSETIVYSQIGSFC